MTAMEEIDYDSIREAEAIISGEIDSTPKTRELAGEWLRMYGIKSLGTHQAKEKEAVCGSGSDVLPGVRKARLSQLRSQAQEAKDHNGNGTLNSCPAVYGQPRSKGMPQPARTRTARGNVSGGDGIL
jgi:hypothetical protein